MRRLIAMLLALLLALGMTAYAEEANECAEFETPEVLKMDVWCDEVQSLQAKLNELGFNCGRADGIFGPRTEAALKELQEAIGWDATGEVRVADLQTLLSLTVADVLSGNVEKPAEVPEVEEAEVSADDQPEAEAEAVEATEAETDQPGVEAGAVEATETETSAESEELEVEAENAETTETEVPAEAADAVEDEVASEEAQPVETLAAEEQPVDGDNLVWDGDFQNPEKHWSNWGHPTVCEVVEIDGKKWLHVVSSGEQFEGMSQAVELRSGDISLPEIYEGKTYRLSFKAFSASESVGKAFICGVHNVTLTKPRSNLEAYWTPEYYLTEEPQEYSCTFIPTKDGSFRVMIGTGLKEQIDAYFTDISITLE